jgi:hypothetical protein
MHNPYEILLSLRENKILYKYLQVSAIIQKPLDHDWVINGTSIYGDTFVSLLSTNVLRISIPIPIKYLIPEEVMDTILDDVEEMIEGVIQLDATGSRPVIYYLIHTTMEGLEKGLITFMEESYKLEELFVRTWQALSRQLNNQDSRKPSPPLQNPEGGNDGSNSIWNIVKDIDTREDDYDDDDDDDDDDLDDEEDESI